MEQLSVGLVLQRVLNDALDTECSDVHIFTVGEELVVQFRLHGVLAEVLRMQGIGTTLLRRIKALAKMDVVESRVPQDGSFYWMSESHESAVRVASLPTVNGEAMVLRLLPKRRQELDFCMLGMSVSQARTVNDLLQKEAGLLLVAGPTSSGKTTTLYAMMEELIRRGRRVVSIEDPVERVIDDCHQLQVRERIGVTFDVGLRAALRQDPDVLMIGEIRDEDTARTALRAALTGHLVLSTTHAKDLVGAVARLVDLGLNRALVSEVLSAVIVQNLELRRPPVSQEAEKPDRTSSGLEDRVAVFSVYQMTSELASMFASSLNWSELRHRLLQSAKSLCYEVS